MPEPQFELGQPVTDRSGRRLEILRVVQVGSRGLATLYACGPEDPYEHKVVHRYEDSLEPVEGTEAPV